MEKEQRSKLQKATQDARRLLEEEFSRQLLETYDINVAAGRWSEEPGVHLQAEQRLLREKLLAWIEHRSAQIKDEKEALLLALREMAFTALNRFVALKLMEARELVRPCVSGGLESEGFQEFTAVAQGLLVEQEGSYRLYLETIFEDVSRELRALFDPRDPASLLWPKRTALLELLDILNRPELTELWREDETLGWIYQYFNGDAERKKMREESSAPRNSRELAVRNQFFTPRYVVEFLTDNTLGRIWYEMRQGDTGLKEDCRYLVRRPNEIWLQSGEEPPAEVVADEAPSQEELLRQPVHIPYRLLKDPREIRMLDPACGSMHFGLYAFDLYLAIYEEAWEIAKGSDEQAKQGEVFAPFVTYAAGFADKATFLREVPRLILQHNIHGVDIDPRATQIARLTLWLRAQRSWQEQGVEVAARPPVTRSNVVCAEPMPGEKELLADFVDQQFPEAERGLVQQLLETIFDKMQLAGEAGSLLKIEEEIRDAIEQAQREWQKLAIQQRDLFSSAELAELGGVAYSLNNDLQNLTKDFWVTIEERIYDALRDYADQAERGGYQRRLFAEDAAQGFAFIDICRKRYDVALMNPPFGEFSSQAVDYMKKAFGDSAVDIYAAFVSRARGVLRTGGLIGAIIPRSLLYYIDFFKFREAEMFDKLQFQLCAELGLGVLDGATVRTMIGVLSPRESHTQETPTLFKRIVVQNEWESGIQAWVQRPETGEIRYANEFASIAGKPLLFALSRRFVNVLSSVTKLDPIAGKFHTGERSGAALIVNGLQTCDDFRFIRTLTEVPAASLGQSWWPLLKATDYQPYEADISLVVDWEESGKRIKAFIEHLGHSPSRYVSGEEHYPAVGSWYPGVCERGNGAATVRFKGIPSRRGIAVISRLAEIDGDYLTGVLNSIVGCGVVGMVMPDRYRNPSYVGLIPVPLATETTSTVTSYVKQLRRSLRGFMADEVSRDFLLPLLSRHEIAELGFAGGVMEILKRRSECIIHMTTLEASIDASLLSALSVSGDDLQVLKDFSNRPEIESWALPEASNEREIVFDAVQYFVGVALGRWDIRYATGEQAAPELPDPFAPLPVCPPGQLQNAQGLPAGTQGLPASYPVCIPWDGILVDDRNHPLDLECRIREVIEIIWSGKEGGATAEAIEHEPCDILGVKTLRDYFRKPAGFFANHLSRYSKSRRQAPIYWQLSAGNGNYSAWLYYHRFTQDTLYRVLGDFVEIRIQEAEREQFELESQGGLSGDAAGLLNEVQALLQDLRLFKSELELVAPLWNPNLNDGVIINHAILWRITPYTPWQKKCKECWDKLVKGDYDWAHLAFHLWPERVISKCTTDRSLAIAHGLEERLWQETSKGSWLQRQLQEAELQALLAEYSKPAVQNALERFLAAPPPVAAARTRAPRATKSSSTGTTRRPRGSAPEVDAETSRQTLLVLTAAPADGLGRNAIAELLGVEAASLTAVIKQLKEGGQIEQLGVARGAMYRLSESGLAAVESQAGDND